MEFGRFLTFVLLKCTYTIIFRDIGAFKLKKKMSFLAAAFMAVLLVGCSNEEEAAVTDSKAEAEVVTPVEKEEKAEPVKEEKEEPVVEKKEPVEEKKEEKPKPKPKPKKDQFAGYTLIVVDGGDLSGTRQSKVVVDIGFGDRKYWAFTNEHGQLVRVIADRITVQDDATEPVKSTGRYYSDEAKVPGVERSDLDEGHIIADSLGGVSNAYNITPQDSTLNRHGDQAYMERVMRDVGGATNFEAIITYPNTTTQIPSRYKYTYTLRGEKIVDEFDNKNPDQENAKQGLTTQKPAAPKPTAPKQNAPAASGNLASVDTNGNGEVTIAEAKAAGYKMPITRDHWLYQYMRDNDNDGMVGE